MALLKPLLIVADRVCRRRFSNTA